MVGTTSGTTSDALLGDSQLDVLYYYINYYHQISETPIEIQVVM